MAEHAAKVPKFANTSTSEQEAQEEGADPDEASMFHQNVSEQIVYQAALNNHTSADIRDLISRCPCDGNFTSKQQRMTLLHRVVQKKLTDEAIMVLSKGSPRVNARDAHGWTALHYAAYWGSVDVCKEILQHENFNAVKETDNVGKTAADWVKKTKGHHEVLELIHKAQKEPQVDVQFGGWQEEANVNGDGDEDVAVPEDNADVAQSSTDLWSVEDVSLLDVLPDPLHKIAHAHGGLWTFVMKTSSATIVQADEVSKSLQAVLLSAEEKPQIQVIAADMLSYLVSWSEWAQINRDRLWQNMEHIFMKMDNWSRALLGTRLCLAMCYFGSNDLEHGGKMRGLLEGVEESPHLMVGYVMASRIGYQSQLGSSG